MWKYIIFHLKSFIKTEKMVFILMVCCVLSSVITLCFTFGFYHHIEQKKTDAEIGIDGFDVESKDDERRTVTKEAYLEVLLGLDEKVWEKLSCIVFCGRFTDEVSDSPPIDNSLLVQYMPFIIRDGKLSPIALKEMWKKNGLWVDGDYFTDEQFENGEYVCIAPDSSIYDSFSGEQREWVRKFMPTERGTFIVGGKEYNCIGHYSMLFFSCEPMVPITTVTDDIYIKSVGVYYEKPLTKYQYETISKALKERFGDLVEIPELDLPEADSMKFYNTLLVLCMVMVVFSGTVLSFLYQYIFLQRKRSLTIYRLCGLSMTRIRVMYFLECLLLVGILYMVGVLTFHTCILPYFGKVFEYMSASYGWYSYSMLGFIYVGISAAILAVLIFTQTKDNIVQELKGI